MGVYHNPNVGSSGPVTTLDGARGPTFTTIPSRRAPLRAVLPPGTVHGAASVQLQRQLAARANRPGGLGDEDQLGGLFSSIGKGLKNVGKTVVKAAKDTGHAAGAVVTSKIGQAVIGGALAATGVGLPAAIAIGAGAQAGGNLIKKGGNLGKAASGAVRGGVEGAAGSLLGTGARKLLNRGSSAPTDATPTLGPPDPSITRSESPVAMVDPIASAVSIAPDAVLPATTTPTAPAAMTAAEATLHHSMTTAPISRTLSPTSSITEKAAAAKKIHDAGQAAKTQSKTLSARAKSLGANAAAIAKKAQIAADAGDAIGASTLAAQARQIFAVAQNTQSAADTASDYAERAGNAVAAATDAGLGAAATNSEGFGNLVAWIEANPGKALVAGGGAVYLLTKVLGGRGGSPIRAWH